jgi:hypothetical protein
VNPISDATHPIQEVVRRVLQDPVFMEILDFLFEPPLLNLAKSLDVDFVRTFFLCILTKRDA